MRGERTPAALVPEGGAPAPAPRPRVDDACSSEEIFADVSDDDEDSSRRARLRREQTEARCVLALFSVALLWCSSLSVADALVRGVLPSPHSRESVVDAVHVAFEHIVRADEDYLRCARRETFACAANVRAAVLAESRRAEVIEAREVELAREAERDADACARLESRAWSLAADAVARGTNHSSSGTNRSRSSPPAFTNASASLRAASPHSDDDVLSIPWRTLPNVSSPAHASTSSSCASPSARAAVRAKLRDPTGAFVSAADDLSASAATFRADSDGTLDAVLAVAERRVAYDKQYAENKTAALTALEAALVANATGEVVALARMAAGALEAGGPGRDARGDAGGDRGPRRPSAEVGAGHRSSDLVAEEDHRLRVPKVGDDDGASERGRHPAAALVLRAEEDVIGPLRRHRGNGPAVS